MRNQLTNVSVKTPKALEHPGTVDDVTYTTETTQNKYGASGKRIERLEKGITTRYYYTGDALLYSTNEKNVLETENILDPAGSVIASKRFLDPSEVDSQKYANKYYVFNYDARGSVTNIIAPNGSVVKGYDYDEFGNTEQKGESDFLNDITFTSSVADTSSNLQYMNSRFYQPSTGRFLSQDSYSGNAYDPWTHNLYSYCGQNPINFIDPTGHAAKKAPGDENYMEAYYIMIMSGWEYDKKRKAAKKAKLDAMKTETENSIYAIRNPKMYDFALSNPPKSKEITIGKYNGEYEEVVTDGTKYMGFGTGINAGPLAIEARPYLVKDVTGKNALKVSFNIGGGISLLPGTEASVSYFPVFGKTDVPRHEFLDGWSYYDGISGTVFVPIEGVPVSAYLGYNNTYTFANDYGDLYVGKEYMAGASIPNAPSLNGNFGVSYTVTLFEFD